ncbi:MAG: hypothetical protein HUU55_18840 [Myxococcales bacterium]|nr:hypothetical protein [Myxococcales bacterium]
MGQNLGAVCSGGDPSAAVGILIVVNGDPGRRIGDRHPGESPFRRRRIKPVALVHGDPAGRIGAVGVVNGDPGGRIGDRHGWGRASDGIPIGIVIVTIGGPGGRIGDRHDFAVRAILPVDGALLLWHKLLQHQRAYNPKGG